MVKKSKQKSDVLFANGVQKFSFVDVIIYIILGLLVVTMIVPFMNIISISLSNYASVVSDKTMLIPKNLNFSAYKIIFNVEVYRAFFLTAFVTVANTTLHIVLCMMAAYTGRVPCNYRGRGNGCICKCQYRFGYFLL